MKWAFHGQDEQERALVGTLMAVAEAEWRRQAEAWVEDYEDRGHAVWCSLAWLPEDEFEARFAEVLRTEHPDVVAELGRLYWPARHGRRYPDPPPRPEDDHRADHPPGLWVRRAIAPSRRVDVGIDLTVDERGRWWAESDAAGHLALVGADPAQAVQRAQAAVLRSMADQLDRGSGEPLGSIRFDFDADVGRHLDGLADDDPRVVVRSLRERFRSQWPNLEVEDWDEPWAGAEQTLSTGRAQAAEAVRRLLVALGEQPPEDQHQLTRRFFDVPGPLSVGSEHLPGEFHWALQVPEPEDERTAKEGEDFTDHLDRFVWECAGAEVAVRGDTHEACIRWPGVTSLTRDEARIYRRLLTTLASIPIEIDREVDGRWIAEIPDMPGVLVYGESEAAARAAVVGLAAQVLASDLKADPEAELPGWLPRSRLNEWYEVLDDPEPPDEAEGEAAP